MDDLISRQAALALAKDIIVPTKDGSAYKHRCIDPDEIRQLPSAQPERKRGRWIIHSDEAGYVVNCSECGNGYAGRRKWNPAAEEYERPSLSKYCPNCGAEMENA